MDAFVPSSDSWFYYNPTDKKKLVHNEQTRGKMLCICEIMYKTNFTEGQLGDLENMFYNILNSQSKSIHTCEYEQYRLW